MKKPFDFSGYATKNNLKCSDGRTIVKDAFKDNDGQTVPLVWQHLHNDPSNVLGHAVLENRQDGVYVYGKFNETQAGANAKQLVAHGDITALSIYANGLVEKSKNVLHGVIREVSLVMSGANPGAFIDNLSFEHADGSRTESEEEAIIYSGLNLSLDDVKHEDKKGSSDKEETLQDVFDTLDEKQKNVVFAMISELMDSIEQSATHSGLEGDEELMKHNVFDKNGEDKNVEKTLTHAQFMEIVDDAQKCGSFREAFLSHAVTYGIENIDYLFPDAKAVRENPDFIKRQTEWVSGLLSGTHHTPFSRIKSLAADITADEARALGYVKGALKKEEVIKLLKRITLPTTIYKKQKLDRDDIIDITDMNVVSWLKSEMRLQLDEELARAILIGDGRSAESEDKIDDTCIRPVYSDVDMYADRTVLASTATTIDKIDAIVRARENYRGSGNPTLYTTSSFVTDMLLLKDKQDRRMYATEAELTAALRVSKIEEVPVMVGVHRDITDPAPATIDLIGIIMNPKDYTVGADQGGQVSMFDDFDIDYNQYKYLLEARCSGALTMPKSALIIEQTRAAG